MLFMYFTTASVDIIYSEIILFIDIIHNSTTPLRIQFRNKSCKLNKIDDQKTKHFYL